MNKQDFLNSLCKRLSSLSENEALEHINFYSEMIDDRIEEGLSEEEAVSAVGGVDEVAGEILSLANKSKNTRHKKSVKVWEIVLLVLGSPMWLPLLLSAFAVFISLYAVLWSVIISLWAVVVSTIFSSAVVLLSAIVSFINLDVYVGIFTIGACVLLAGLSILFFLLSKALTRFTVRLTLKALLRLKKTLKKRGEQSE